MIEFFREPAVVRQHRAAPVIGQYIDGIAGHLAQAGYSRTTVRRYIYACEGFGRFLADHRVELHEVDETHVEEFLSDVASHRTWHGSAVDGIGAVRGRQRPVTLLLAQLREAGVVVPARPDSAEVEPPHHALLAGYIDFLRHHRGIQEVTIRQHRLLVGRFLGFIDSDAGAIRHLSAGDLDGFIVECGERMTRRSISRVSAALRGFLRYIHLSGQIDHDLSPQVAAPRVYALETVPRALAWADVVKLLATPDRSTAPGRRDYAILLLLAVYGLRAGEVATLSLEDIDWRGNQLQIHQSKGGDPTWYPLHPDVGAAIADYLLQGRPVTSVQRIFVTFSAPVRAFTRSTPISNIVMRQLCRAGIDSPHWGAHTLRHSRAVHLLQQGFSLTAIGDLLGHHNMQSTFTYTKAALEDLRCVGLEGTEILP